MELKSQEWIKFHFISLKNDNIEINALQKLTQFVENPILVYGIFEMILILKKYRVKLIKRKQTPNYRIRTPTNWFSWFFEMLFHVYQ